MERSILTFSGQVLAHFARHPEDSIDTTARALGMASRYVQKVAVELVERGYLTTTRIDGRSLRRVPAGPLGGLAAAIAAVEAGASVQDKPFDSDPE